MSQNRTVVVSTFSPRKDGIARYADQLVDTLRRLGIDVLPIGLPGSDAEVCLPLDRGLRTLALLRKTRRTDRLVLMWHPEFFVRGRFWNRTATYVALGIVARLRQTSAVIHEPDMYSLRRRSGLRALVDAVERNRREWFWNSGLKLCFHSRRERNEFFEIHPGVRGSSQVVVRDHGEFFRAYARAEPMEARQKLRLPDGLVLVCAGFIGRHKGFDRALRAFAELPKGSASLLIIGSLLYDTADERAYLDELRELAGRVDGARLEECYLNDEELDLLIQAADAVIAPYWSSASSGIVARARLFGTRIVATDVGGLPEQLGPDDVLVRTDDDLRDAMLEFVRSEA
jgi:glycosyltransferase involved in cell wall biosynthesis